LLGPYRRRLRSRCGSRVEATTRPTQHHASPDMATAQSLSYRPLKRTLGLYHVKRVIRNVQGNTQGNACFLYILINVKNIQVPFKNRRSFSYSASRYDTVSASPSDFRPTNVRDVPCHQSQLNFRSFSESIFTKGRVHVKFDYRDVHCNNNWRPFPS
jgi:hypothetical protein